MSALTPFLASHVSSSSSSILVFFLSNNSPFPIKQQQQQPMFSLLFFIFIFSFTLYLLFFIYKKFNKTNQKQEEREEEKQQQQQQTRNEEDPSSLLKPSLSKIFDKTHQTRETDPTHLTHSLLLEILPSDSAKWAGLFGEKQRCEDPVSVWSVQERETDGSGGDQRGKKKKKRRGKKKRLDLNGEEEKGEENPGSGPRVNPKLVCLYPFTSTSSATQRKIKQQYDQLVKCHESKGLTLAQVGEFANCLIEARNELQHKSEVIKRKFTITKALLFKADRSSYDRLRQQIYKLEMEQKRLEEDAFVCNWLQQQLKLSPAYKKMLEISACMEMKAKSGELMESTDTEFADISFEELLAQEKKDSFWQKNGKSRLCSG